MRFQTATEIKGGTNETAFFAAMFVLILHGLTARGGMASSQTQAQQNASKSLSDAVKKSDWEKVRQLIAAGTGIGYRDGSNVSPLFLLANHGPDELVRSAVEAGADVNATVNAGCSPLMYALAYVKDVMLVEGLDFDVRDGVMEPIRELEYDPNPAGLGFLEVDRARCEGMEAADSDGDREAASSPGVIGNPCRSRIPDDRPRIS